MPPLIRTAGSQAVRTGQLYGVAGIELSSSAPQASLICPLLYASPLPENCHEQLVRSSVVEFSATPTLSIV